MEMAAVLEKRAKCDKCKKQYIILTNRPRISFICKKCKRKQNNYDIETRIIKR